MAGEYKVEYLETTPATDITKFIHTIDDLVIYTDGRISSARCTVDATFGQFMSNARGGVTPLVDQYQRFKFTFTDSDGNEKSKIMELMTDLSQLTLEGDYLLPIEFEGREHHLAYIPFSGFYEFTNHYDMADQVLLSYDADKGSKQPFFLTDDGPTDTNKLPKFNPNLWDFQYIDNCLDALKEIIKNANLSVPAGGAGNRFSLIFDDDPLNPPTPVNPGSVIVRIIPQGSRNEGVTPKPIVQNSIAVPIKKLDKLKHPMTGTRVIARGRPGSGRTPTASDLYRGRLEYWLAIPEYDNAKEYVEGAYVVYGASKYICISPTPITGILPTDATKWTAKTFGEYVGNFNYSPLTKDKATVYKNQCGNPTAAYDNQSLTSPKVMDCNIVINDNKTQRDFVYFRSNTDIVASLSTLQKSYLLNHTDFYEGFRMLIDVSNLGTATGTFAPGTNSYGMGNGKDPRGVTFANNAVVYHNGKWYVFNEPNSSNPDIPRDTPVDYQQYVVILEGTIYEWNVNFTPIASASPGDRRAASTNRKRSNGTGTPDRWKNIGAEFLGNDCWHSPNIIENVDGLITPREKTPGVNYTDDSGLRITYGYEADLKTEEWKQTLDKIRGIVIAITGFIAPLVISLTSQVLNLFATPYYQNMGWWWTFNVPFPFSTANAISEEVGEIYGGDANTINQHALFDKYNQRRTLKGGEGWNQEDSKEMMEITGVTFLYKLDITADGQRIPFTGDIPCSYWVIDNNGTIWKSKQMYRFLGDVQRFTFEFGDFTPVYRARTPIGIDNIVENIIVPELEIRERLFPNRIKFQGFMLEASYDEHGRYMPNIWEQIVKPTVFQMFSGQGGTVSILFDGVIDDFAWVKTPIAISEPDSETDLRAIFSEIKDYPNITNLEQLQRVADADLDIEEFRYEQYTVIQNDKADLDMQDTVYLKDNYMIKETDLVGTPNTRELTVNECHFIVTNTHDFQRKLVLVRRIPIP